MLKFGYNSQRFPRVLREQTLFQIANAMSMSLTLDTAAQNRVFSHYARILVDMDLSRNIFEEVMVERDDFASTQKEMILPSTYKCHRISLVTP